MTKVKENAAIQLSAATSTSFDQINTFAHEYDRGVTSRSTANLRTRSIRLLIHSSRSRRLV
ncbi:hypothetical protein KPSA3_03049 [Pseudomonas syringae pv. actinidiae]|uniref:Uncharacterized protein n=1 Tax=Pseudomonas syringae pv. actinidiae TaxID=103796 RepID=A0AAN4Q4W6_PSESF|nr:hypothetical protein KPSA3_03049 [Pseudomonas syringae pv. actinidiae]